MQDVKRFGTRSEPLILKSKEYIQTFKNFSKILNSNTKYNEPKIPPLNHTYPIQT